MSKTIKLLQLIVFGYLIAIASAGYPDRQCLDCMCLASSGCNIDLKCHNAGPGQYYCGPYQISWAYWADSGKPGDTGDAHSFETCLNNKQCAEQSIQGYMNKLATDCNKDGYVDCLDFAAIHKTGAGGPDCKPNWLLESKYWQEFIKCYQPTTHSVTSSESVEVSFANNNNSSIRSISNLLSSPRFMDNVDNQPASSTLIEVPRPPKPAALRQPSSIFELPPFPSLPPVFARASASVPGASASASASAGFHSDLSPNTFLHTSIINNDNSDDEADNIVEITHFTPPRPRVVHGRRPQPLPSPGPHFNKPLSSPVSSNFRPDTPTRLVFPGPQANHNNFQKPTPRPTPTSAVNSQPSNDHYDSNVVVSTSSFTIPNPKNEETETTNNDANFIEQDCLNCLCHASSKCDLNKGCDGAYCGPYLLSWGYWADGGQPGGEYASCSKQKSCSENAIRGYMGKWKRDCNKDGKIDCIDFALIHKLGPHGCEKLQALESTDYWKQFQQCSSDPSISNVNKPVRSTRPILVELPKPSLNLIGSRNRESNSGEREPFIGPLPKPPTAAPPPPPGPPRSNWEINENTLNPGDVIIRVNNRDLVNSANNRRNSNLPLRPTGPPRRLDLTHLDPSRPVIIRIKPPGTLNNNNNNNEPAHPTPAPRSRPISIPPLQPTRPQPRPRPRTDDDGLIETRPRRPSPTPRIDNNNNNNEEFFSHPRPSEPNESSNVFEVSRRPNIEDDRPLTASRPSIKPKPISRQNTTNELVGRECLECICYAASKCDLSIGCRSEGSGKYVCGPYQADWEYWAEAGKPGNRGDLSNLENLQMCLNNRDCADRTVKEYIKRFKKDCNEDGAIDCYDFAALHVAGPNQCNAQWYLDSKYYSDFRECFDF